MDATKIKYGGAYNTDLILGTYSGSIFSPAPAATPFTHTSTSVTIPTNIPETTFFQGVFSTDGGTTWLDLNSQTPNLTAPGLAVLQTQVMYGHSVLNGLVLTADNWSYYNGTTTTSASYTFLYKVVIFARPGQGDVTPQPVVQKVNFNTKNNYQKISRDSAANITLPVGTVTVNVAHNLGYIPKIRHYIEDFSYGPTTGLYDFGFYASQYTLFNCSIDTTQVSYFFDNSTGTGPLTAKLYTRIYYDS
jgi:hypothetical protein